MELFRLISLLPSGQTDKNRVIATFVDALATEGKPNKKLFDQIRDVMRLKHYTLRTERAYIDWIRRLISFHSKIISGFA